jgi:hypothetical protein
VNPKGREKKAAKSVLGDLFCSIKLMWEMGQGTTTF